MKNPDKMTSKELARAMGKDYFWVRDELRRDSKRDIPHWPFAKSKQGPTGQWSYLIIRSQYEKWASGELAGLQVINYDLLTDQLAEKVYAKLKGA